LEIAFVVDAFEDRSAVDRSPWYYYANQLRQSSEISVQLFRGLTNAWRPFDAMILMVWLDWANPEKFDTPKVMQVLERYSAYRATFPGTLQIALNHIDYTTKPYALPYWRRGDPILCRTPPYDHSLLAPFPPIDIFPYEFVWGSPSFECDDIAHHAGFIGSRSGFGGYRERVASETSKVGIGYCVTDRLSYGEYAAMMSKCRIIVCPQGWGGGSLRHWDAWKSNKPVLTDRNCSLLEMIPGETLQERVHYLVYDDPSEIPDIVSDWTKLSRRADLEAIAARGRAAALSYDACAQMNTFFDNLGIGAGSLEKSQT